MLQLYKNIKNKRLELGYTQAELAKRVGYSDRSMITKVEKGQVDLSQSMILAFADALETTASELMGNDGIIESPLPTSSKRGVKIPILGSVPCGAPAETVENIIGWEEITPELAKTGEFYCLQIKGDSMYPMFMEGDIVVVKVQPEAESGEYVIAKVNGEEATLKKLQRNENSLVLQPLNPNYEPMSFTKEEVSEKPVTILGRVIEIRREV